MPAGAKVPDSTAIVLYHFNDVWDPVSMAGLATLKHDFTICAGKEAKTRLMICLLDHSQGSSVSTREHRTSIWRRTC